MASPSPRREGRRLPGGTVWLAVCVVIVGYGGRNHPDCAAVNRQLRLRAFKVSRKVAAVKTYLHSSATHCRVPLLPRPRNLNSPTYGDLRLHCPRQGPCAVTRNSLPVEPALRGAGRGELSGCGWGCILGAVADAIASFGRLAG